MSRDPARVDAEALSGVVRRAVADVMMVDPAEIDDRCSLIDDLGAESIDFLDLIFRLEDSLAAGMAIQDLEAYLKARFPVGDIWSHVTPEVVADFASTFPVAAHPWPGPTPVTRSRD